MGQSRHAVKTYYLTPKQLEEARKGAKCDLENGKKQRSSGFSLPKTKRRREQF